MYSVSDELVVDGFLKNPYCQYYFGQAIFHETPFEKISLFFNHLPGIGRQEQKWLAVNRFDGRGPALPSVRSRVIGDNTINHSLEM